MWKARASQCRGCVSLRGRTEKKANCNPNWQVKFEPRVWHHDMQSAPLANRYEWLCAWLDRCLLGDFLFFFEVHVGPWHALLGLIIVLHYLWVPQPLKSWHATGLADTPPMLCAFNASPRASWILKPRLHDSETSSSICYFSTSNCIFYLKLSDLHINNVLFYPLPVLPRSKTSSFQKVRNGKELRWEWTSPTGYNSKLFL